MRTCALLTMTWLVAATACYSQGSTAAANSAVKVDSLIVYSEARQSSDVVRTLKKGDALFVELELKLGPEKWCSVRLPSESARIGFVACDGLERTDRRTGDLALPADAPPSSSAPSAVAGSTKPSPIALPRARSSLESTSEYEKVRAAVIHDDILDGPKIAEFEQAARSGSPAAVTRAAIAHNAAALFELAHNDSDQAIEQFQAALPFATKQPSVLLSTLISLSYVHLVRSEYSAALDNLAQARRISPGSAAIAQLSGWAYYGMNNLDEAIKEWETAQKIQPNQQIASLLENARRDKGVEQGARQSETSHFILHYQGAATPQLANDILRTLEEHFRGLQTDLRFTPPESIGVILYTQQTFRDITRAPSWAGALNDGRIRVPVQGLDSVTDDLSRVLKHELTHSFVRQMTLGRCPTWLNEGLAQWMEGRRSGDAAQALVAAYDRGATVSLQRLEGPWNSFPAPAAAFAYAWSLAAVESVMARSGLYTITRLLGDLPHATSVEAALREALQMNYADFDRQTAEYLRQTYAQ